MNLFHNLSALERGGGKIAEKIIHAELRETFGGILARLIQGLRMNQMMRWLSDWLHDGVVAIFRINVSFVTRIAAIHLASGVRYRQQQQRHK